jgi:hypothetical protein
MTAERAFLVCGFAMLLSGIADRAKADTGASTLSAQAGPGNKELRNEDEGSTTILKIPSAGSYQPLTGKERWNLFLREAFWRRGVFFRAAGPALGAQLNNEPPEWGQGVGAYSKR